MMDDLHKWWSSYLSQTFVKFMQETIMVREFVELCWWKLSKLHPGSVNDSMKHLPMKEIQIQQQIKL